MQRAPYLPMPTLSPYLGDAQYRQPKRDFVNLVERLGKVIDYKNGSGLMVDLGCANGGLLYLLKQQVGSGWKLKGIDFLPEFIDEAKRHPEMSGIEMEVGNIRDFHGPADVILCTGTVPIFPDVEALLDQLLNCLNAGGVLALDGLFNEFDVDVVYQYRDNSKPESRGKWRCDFNIHSQRRIAEFLKPRTKKFSFSRLEMDIDLPRNADAPHINIWSDRMANGTRVKRHGGGLIIDTHLLLVQK